MGWRTVRLETRTRQRQRPLNKGPETWCLSLSSGDKQDMWTTFKSTSKLSLHVVYTTYVAHQASLSDLLSLLSCYVRPLQGRGSHFFYISHDAGVAYGPSSNRTWTM